MEKNGTVEAPEKAAGKVVISILFAVLLLFAFFGIKALIVGDSETTRSLHGLWCLVGLIIVSGSLGGGIFSLNSPTAHKLSLPLFDIEINSGFLGHLFIGIGGAFVAIAAAAQFLTLDLGLFNRVWINFDDLELVPTVLYVIAISILGGFSGLKIISGLSDTLLKQLQREMEETNIKNKKQFSEQEEKLIETKASYEKKVLALEAELKENTAHDNERAKEQHLLKGAFYVEAKKYSDGIIKLDYCTSNYPEWSKPWMWKAVAYKGLKEYDKAVSLAETAIELEGDNWVYLYNYACYTCLVGKVSNTEVVNILKKSYDLLKLDDDFIEFKQLVNNDDDFTGIRDSIEFQTYIDEISS